MSWSQATLPRWWARAGVRVSKLSEAGALGREAAHEQSPLMSTSVPSHLARLRQVGAPVTLGNLSKEPMQYLHRFCPKHGNQGLPEEGEDEEEGGKGNTWSTGHDNLPHATPLAQGTAFSVRLPSAHKHI